MTFDELMGRIHRALTTYTRDTGQQMRTEHLALDIHPDDWREIALTMPMDAVTLAGAKVYGIALRAEPLVAPGRPVLRSTWEVVL